MKVGSQAVIRMQLLRMSYDQLSQEPVRRAAPVVAMTMMRSVGGAAALPHRRDR